MNEGSPSHQPLASRLTDRFRVHSGVEAIALAGSQALGSGDAISDIDLYVYTTSEISLCDRAALVKASGAGRADLNMRFWDLGDEWVDAETGIEVDVIYWHSAWIEAQIDRVLTQHRASLGYSTCFWHTVRHSQILYDRQGWLRALKERCEQPYPEELVQAIVAMNHPVLRRVIPSYARQIEKAVQRRDLVGANHRVAALLASYFDVVFALNRVPHPGEKQLLKIATERCAKLPKGMATHVEALLHAAASVDEDLLVRVERLLDGLDQLLLEEGFDPETSLPAAGSAAPGLTILHWDGE